MTSATRVGSNIDLNSEECVCHGDVARSMFRWTRDGGQTFRAMKKPRAFVDAAAQVSVDRGLAWLLVARAQRHSNFWRLLALFRRAKFGVSSTLFGMREHLRESRSKVAVVTAVVRLVLANALLALGFVAAAYFLERLAVGLLRVDDLVPQVAWGSEAVIGAQVSLYSTIAQIAGVFLGLYFTTVSLLATTAYRDTTAALRAELLQEKFGTVYLQAVAVSGAAALICLGLLSIGVTPGFFCVLLIGASSVAAVLAFVVLGLRAVQLYDPSELVAVLCGRVLRAAHAVTPSGPYWRDASFQKHEHKRALRAMATLTATRDATAEAPNSDESLRMVALHVLRVLLVYSGEKQRIPVDSQWFERAYRHQSWLTADSTALEVLMHQEVDAFPTEAINHEWLDQRLVDMSLGVLSALITRDAGEEALGLLAEMNGVIEKLAERFHLDAATRLHQGMLAAVSAMPVPASSEHDDVAERHDGAEDAKRLYLGMITAVMSSPSHMIVAIGRSAVALSEEKVAALASAVASGATDTAPTADFPPGARQEFVQVQEAIAFERSVEGAVRTPAWAIEAVAARATAQAFKSIIEHQLAYAERIYLPLAESLATQHDAAAEAATVVVQNGREQIKRLEFQAARIARAIQELQRCDRKFEGTPWPSVEMGAVMSRLDAQGERLLGALINASPQLGPGKPNGRLPDAFGYACTTMASEFMHAVLTGRPAVAARIFPAYLPMALRAFDRVRRELESAAPETQLIYAADILLEIVELSGFAYLDSALPADSGDVSVLWNSVAACWNRYLDEVEDAKRVIRMLVSFDDFRRGRFVMSGRSLMQTGWSQQFMRCVAARGYGEYDDYLDRPRGVLKSPISPVAATFISSALHGRHAREAFYYAFLRARADAQAVAWSADSERFERAVARLVLDRKKRP